MYRKWLNEIKLLDGVKATGESVAYPIADYEQMMLTLASANNGEFTIKVVGSYMDEQPDFSQASDKDNRWTTISVRNLEDGTNSMLNMMYSLIFVLIGVSIILAVVIIYNLGILSFTEKEYQFATLKVLGFKYKQIKKTYVRNNNN